MSFRRVLLQFRTDDAAISEFLAVVVSLALLLPLISGSVLYVAWLHVHQVATDATARNASRAYLLLPTVTGPGLNAIGGSRSTAEQVLAQTAQNLARYSYCIDRGSDTCNKDGTSTPECRFGFYDTLSVARNATWDTLSGDQPPGLAADAVTPNGVVFTLAVCKATMPLLGVFAATHEFRSVQLGVVPCTRLWADGKTADSC